MKRPSAYLPAISASVKRLSLAFLLLGGTVWVTSGQNRAELEQQRRQKEREIAQTRQRLQETRKERRATLEYMEELTNQIRRRQEYLGTLQNQRHLLDNRIAKQSDVTAALERDLANLRKEYGQLLYFMYRNRGAYNTLSFIFSSNTFNDAVKRARMVQFYTEFRQKQMELIQRTEESLVSRLTDLKANLKEKTLVESAIGNEKKSLESDRAEQDQLAGKLHQEEGELRRQLAEKQRVADRLDKAIRDIIAREVAAASRKNSSSGSSSNRSGSSRNEAPKDEKLSAKFEGNRARLPWPVEKGNICERFGRHELAGMKGYIVDSKGLKFCVAQDAQVRALFGGEVTRLVRIPNAGIAVIIRHGDYFSVYSGLDEVNVRVGDEVTARAGLGTVGKNVINDSYEVGLQIWHGKQILDPEGWLAKR